MKEFIYKLTKIKKFFLYFDSFFQKILKTFQTVKKKGVRFHSSVDENARIKLTNELSIYLVGICFLLEISFFITKSWLLFYLVGIVLFLTLLVPILNQRLKFKFASLLLHTSFTCFIFFLPYLLDFYFELHYFYLILLILPNFIFFKEEKKSILLSSLFVIFLFLLTHQPEYQIYSNKENVSFKLFILHTLSFLLSSLFLIRLIFFARQVFQRQDEIERQRKNFLTILKDEVLERQNMQESWLNAVKLQEDIMNCIPSNAMILDKDGYLLRHNAFSEPFPKENITKVKNFKIGVSFPTVLNEFYSNTNLNISKIQAQFSKDFNEVENYLNIEFQYSSCSKTYWYSIEMTKIQNESFSGFFLLHRDFTAQKKAELELERLSKIQQALQKILPNLILNLTKEGKVIDFHADKDSSLNILGDLKVGKNLQDLDIPSSLLTEILNKVHEVLETGSSQVIKHPIQFKNQTYIYETRIAQIDLEEVLVILKKI